MFGLNVIDKTACGDCQVCCHVYPIEELDKPAYEPCRHLCAAGCGIYPDRPPVCAHYYCTWRQGCLTGEQNRPDNLGVLITAHGAVQGKQLILVHEARPGALGEVKDRLAYLVSRVARRYKWDKFEVLNIPYGNKSEWIESLDSIHFEDPDREWWGTLVG